jgi:hypothetical protein
MGTLLTEYLLHEVSNINSSFVRNIFSTGAKKNDIPKFITAFICAHTLTNNIWVYCQVKMYYEEIEKCKTNEKDKEKLANLCYGLFHLIGNCHKAQYIFWNQTEKAEIFKADINAILVHTGRSEHEELLCLRDILCEETYALFNIVYERFLYSVESKVVLQELFTILRYVLALTPKFYLASSHYKIEMDIIDLMYLLCVIYSNNSYCPPEVRDYITLSKDLFYYKLSKKDKRVRVNLLFYTIHVIINKQITNQPFDYDGMQYVESLKHDNGLSINEESQSTGALNTSKQKKIHVNEDLEDKCKYLYVYMEYDEELRNIMQYESEKHKMMNKLLRNATKDIEVDSLLSRESSHVKLTKLHNAKKHEY